MSKSEGIDATEPLRESRRREQLIERFLVGLGNTWASTYSQKMSQANRNVEGGWPGTLAEARALVFRELATELAARDMAAPSARELAASAASVNEHARAEWLRIGKAQRHARRGAE